MAGVIAFDTETRGLDWFNRETAFLASWADADGEYAADLGEPAQVRAFIAALENADTLVCHNLAFDVHQVRATLGWDALEKGKTLHDTDLMSRVMFPEGQRKGERGGHGLKNLAQVWLKADAKDEENAIKEMAKSIGLRTLKKPGAYHEVYRAYPERMIEYAKADARYTYDLFIKFSEDLNGAGDIYRLEQQVAPILIRAEARGVSIDVPRATRLKGLYEDERVALESWLTSTLGEGTFAGEGSEQGLLDALLEAGVPLYRKTKTGKLSTNAYALNEFEKDHEVIGKLQEWRRIKRFLDTYLGPMLASGGTLHTSFRQCEAWTGRMSSARPNLQNLPKRAGKEVRSPIVPRDGYALVVCDYSSVEPRLLAYYMADEAYSNLIAEGFDPHAWMAASIHGGKPDEYLKGTPGEEVRNTAKNTLLAISYGAGAPRVADMNGITRDEAKALISKIKSALPKYNKLMSRIRKKVEREGHVTTLMGRKQIVNPDKAYVGLNALIQGSAADIMKQGIINVHRNTKDLGAELLLVVHDEVVLEVPYDNAQKALEAAKESMIAAYDLYPPLEVDGQVVTSNYSAA